MAERHQPHGRHILVDVWGVDFDTLNDPDTMKSAMLGAAEAAGATVVGASFHRFPVQGLSGVVLLAESHISVHTFPEHSYGAFDIFTCGSRVDPERACRHLMETLQASRTSVRRFSRGRTDGIREFAVSSRPSLRAAAP